VVAGDGSPTPELSLKRDTNVTAGATAAGDPATSTGPTGDASPSAAVADDDVSVEESGASWDTPLGLPVMSP
jgi:hypothetical protein